MNSKKKKKKKKKKKGGATTEPLGTPEGYILRFIKTITSFYFLWQYLTIFTFFPVEIHVFHFQIN